MHGLSGYWHRPQPRRPGIVVGFGTSCGARVPCMAATAGLRQAVEADPQVVSNRPAVAGSLREDRGRRRDRTRRASRRECVRHHGCRRRRRVARGGGADLSTGAGLDEAFARVDRVIDVSNSATKDEANATAFFTSAAEHVQAAADRAGADRIVLLSIVGIDRVRSGYYAAELAHEEATQAAWSRPWCCDPPSSTSSPARCSRGIGRAR